MRAFLIWLASFAIAFGGMSGGYHYHLSTSPKQIAVVVDTSYPMAAAWGQVAELLDAVDGAPYTRYALLTDKRRVHGWSSRLSWTDLSPYAPRDFSKLEGGNRYPELDQADEVYFLTNADAFELERFEDWRVVRPGP